MLCKAFANGSSANIKLSKAQLHGIRQWGGSLGRLLGPILKGGLSLTKNKLKSLAKSVLIPLGLTAAAAAAASDAPIHEKIFGSDTIILIISNEETNDIIKKLISVEKSGSLIKGVSEKIKNEAKEQKRGFRYIISSLIGNLLTGKGAMGTAEGTIRLNQIKLLMSIHHLTNFEKQKCYQNEPKFKSVYSRNNLSKIKDGAYVKNIDGYESIGTNWIALHVNVNKIIYFDSFGFAGIPKKKKKVVGDKNVISNIYRLQAHDPIMCGYFYIGFIDFMLKDKGLLDYTNLFFSNENEKNHKMILKYFQDLKMLGWKKYFVICGKYRKFENLKHHTF